MKKLLFCLVTLLSLQSFAQHEHYAGVKIFQNGKEVQHSLGVFKLQRAPFQFSIGLSGVDGFYVSADQANTTYSIPFSQPLPNYTANVVKESAKGNSAKQLNLSSTGWSYWSPSKQSFDATSSADAHGVVTYTRTVDHLYNTATKSVVPLTQAAPVYLYFVAKQPNGKDEFVRLRYSIQWL